MKKILTTFALAAMALTVSAAENTTHTTGTGTPRTKNTSIMHKTASTTVGKMEKRTENEKPMMASEVDTMTKSHTTNTTGTSTKKTTKKTAVKKTDKKVKSPTATTSTVL